MGKIAQQTLTAAQATIDFPAIPSTYRHLLATIEGRGDAVATSVIVFLALNGDVTAADYSSSDTANPRRAGTLYAGSAPAGQFNETEITIPNYTTTAQHKSWRATSSDTTVAGGQDTASGFWIPATDAAVTDVTLSLASGNFAAGTVATLYGVDSQVAGVAGAPYQTTKVQLDYAAATDIASALAVSANTWTDIGTNQSFTVDDGASIVEIDAGGMIYLTGMATGGASGARLVIDSAGTPTYKQIAGSPTSANLASSPLAGASTVTVTGLTAGAHTVKVQIMSAIAATAYCRASSQAGYESLAIRVIERKVTLPAALVPGAGVLSIKTASYTLTTSDVTIIANAASLTMTLPSAATVGAGRAYTIKNGASGTGTTVATTGAQTIDGAATQAIAAAYGALSVVSDGANWAITAKV